MAMFTLIEFNGDHLEDLLMGDKSEEPADYLASVLQAVIRNPSNASLLESCDLYRVIRVVKQSGERYVKPPTEKELFERNPWVRELLMGRRPTDEEVLQLVNMCMGK